MFISHVQYCSRACHFVEIEIRSTSRYSNSETDGIFYNLKIDDNLEFFVSITGIGIGDAEFRIGKVFSSPFLKVCESISMEKNNVKCSFIRKRLCINVM